MKIVVDENLPPALARALQAIFLQAIFVAEHEIIYLRDRFGPRVTDLEWIETLSRESRWVIISGDRRITRNKAEYNAFRASTLIGFFLSAGLNKARLTKKAERLLALWDGIAALAARMEGGAMFELQMKSKRIGQLK